MRNHSQIKEKTRALLEGFRLARSSGEWQRNARTRSTCKPAIKNAKTVPTNISCLAQIMQAARLKSE